MLRLLYVEVATGKTDQAATAQSKLNELLDRPADTAAITPRSAWLDKHASTSPRPPRTRPNNAGEHPHGRSAYLPDAAAVISFYGE